jgi:hypothetical protein
MILRVVFRDAGGRPMIFHPTAASVTHHIRPALSNPGKDLVFMAQTGMEVFINRTHIIYAELSQA